MIKSVFLLVFSPIRYLHGSLPLDSVFRKLLATVIYAVKKYHIMPDSETVRIPGSSGFVLENCNSSILFLMYWSGQHGYEGVMIDYWSSLCAHSSAALELGANIGVYTVAGAKAMGGKEYVCVEANPHNASILRRNIRLNGLKNVKVIEGAVVGGSGGGTVRLAVPNEGWIVTTTAYIEDAAAKFSNRMPDREVLEVGAIGINNLIKTGNKPDLIKMDIEGLELDILRSIEDYLIHEKPTIIVELLQGMDDLKAFLVHLASACGYKTFAVPKYKYHHAIEIDLEKTDYSTLASYKSGDLILTVNGLPF